MHFEHYPRLMMQHHSNANIRYNNLQKMPTQDVGAAASEISMPMCNQSLQKHFWLYEISIQAYI